MAIEYEEEHTLDGLYLKPVGLTNTDLIPCEINAAVQALACLPGIFTEENFKKSNDEEKGDTKGLSNLV